MVVFFALFVFLGVYHRVVESSGKVTIYFTANWTSYRIFGFILHTVPFQNTFVVEHVPAFRGVCQMANKNGFGAYRASDILLFYGDWLLFRLFF